MTCDITSFLTVFQSYQDDGKVTAKGCLQYNPVYGSPAGLESSAAGSVVCELQGLLRPKDADGMENSIGLDQTAPSGVA